MLDHLLRRGRVVERVGEHAERHTLADEPRALVLDVPLTHEGVAEVVRAHQRAVGRPTPPQVGILRALPQQPAKPLPEQPVTCRLVRQAGGDDADVHLTGGRRLVTDELADDPADLVGGGTGVAGVQDQQELAGTGGHDVGCDVGDGEPGVAGGPAVSREQPQLTCGRTDPVTGPQERQRTAVREQIGAVAKVAPRRLLVRVEQRGAGHVVEEDRAQVLDVAAGVSQVEQVLLLVGADPDGDQQAAVPVRHGHLPPSWSC